MFLEHNDNDLGSGLNGKGELVHINVSNFIDVTQRKCGNCINGEACVEGNDNGNYVKCLSLKSVFRQLDNSCDTPACNDYSKKL